MISQHSKSKKILKISGKLAPQLTGEQRPAAKKKPRNPIGTDRKHLWKLMATIVSGFIADTDFFFWKNISESPSFY